MAFFTALPACFACKKFRKIRSSDVALIKVIDKTFKDHHGFVVHTENFYPKGIEAARYIGRYLGHLPLSTSHSMSLS